MLNVGVADAPRDVVYLFPHLFLSPGGIQGVNQDMVRAMTTAWPDARHRILLYRDRAVPASRDGGGGQVRLIPCGMRSRTLAHLRFAAVFGGLLVRARPDLIVVGHVAFGPLAWMAKVLCGVPYIVWAHGTEVWGLRRGLRAASLANATRVVAVSRYTAERLAALDADLVKRTVIVPPAVRAPFRPGSRAEARRRLGLDDVRVLLTLGRQSRAERHKGCDAVLRALPRVLARAPGTRYVVAGDGDDLERLRGLADRLGVAHAVSFAGAVPADELPAYYNACDLFVMPSRRQGFGVVFIEALACGTPVIAGDAGGSRDAVLNGRLGRMVDPGEPEWLARAILDYLEGRWPPELTDPEHLSRTCIEHFGFAAFERRVRDLVRSVSAARTTVPPAAAGG